MMKKNKFFSPKKILGKFSGARNSENFLVSNLRANLR